MVAGDPPPPPEHPARKVIREALRKLSDELDQFEQATHGIGDSHMETVGSYLADCYEHPTPYSISSLSQVINNLLEKDAKHGNA